MRNKGFEGWYFKHQRGGKTLAFIPGRAESGAFIQMLTDEGARSFAVSSFASHGDSVCADRCLFTPYGCRVTLSGVCGVLCYRAPMPLHSDIMGPFRFLPMECRHGVVSMAHRLSGTLTVNGRPCCFDGGTGYIEKDSGISFPCAYQWLQCNDFDVPCALMASVARIPFGGMHFTGCICAILYRGREYRLATYHGVRLFAANERQLLLRQGALLLAVTIEPMHGGHALHAPLRGQMTEVIRERVNARIRARLWDGGRRVFDLYSAHAAYEYVPLCNLGLRKAL